MRIHLFLLSFLMMVKLLAGNTDISANEQSDSSKELHDDLQKNLKEMIQIIKKIFEPWKDEVLETRDSLFEYFKKNNYFRTGEKGLFNYACVMTVSTLFRFKKKTLALGALPFFACEVHENLSEDNKKKVKDIVKDIKISLNHLSSSQ
jgi:hypothetical protein